MGSNTIPDLDSPGRPVSILHSIDPNSLKFIHRGQTEEELVQALYKVMYAPFAKRGRIWLLASESEVFLLFFVCSIMVYKKKSLGRIWLITKRESAFGTFYVSNAVFALFLGASVYLISWSIYAVIILTFSYTGRSPMEWWWFIPAPWWPLAVGCYMSVHGFIVVCSPRSPLSFGLSAKVGSHHPWLYLPLPNSSAICNIMLVLPCVLFTFSTIIVTSCPGRSYYHAKALAQRVLPLEILQSMKMLAQGHPHDFDGNHILASDELIWMARQVAAAYSDCHRYVAINMGVFAAFDLGFLWLTCVVYGIPNVISLVNHACSRHSQPLPPSCRTFFTKLWWLAFKGKPKDEHSTTHLNLHTWKMTLLAIVYVFIVVVADPAYGWIPIFVACNTFPERILTGDVSTTIYVTISAVSVITIITCSFIAIFCTVASLDPLFRAAIGLNMMRTQIPIDIHLDHHRSQHDEFDLESPTFKTGDGILTQDHDHTLFTKPSASSFNSSKHLLPRVGKDSDESSGQNLHVGLESKPGFRK